MLSPESKRAWIERIVPIDSGVVATDSPNGFADSVYVDLALLDAVRAAVDAVLVFVDGFESGGGAGWSVTSGDGGPDGRPARRRGN